MLFQSGKRTLLKNAIKRRDNAIDELVKYVYNKRE